MSLPDIASFTRWAWFMPTLEEYKRSWQSAFGCPGGAENADRFFPDAPTMTRWIDQPSLVPFLAHLAAADQQPFRAFVVEQMIRETRQQDGRCFETFRRINVSARKEQARPPRD
jgi:hypothetical protein